MNIDYLKHYAEIAGSNFFDRETMSFFNSLICHSTMTKIDADTYRFVTSERMDEDHPRRYTVREWHRDSSGDHLHVEVATVGDFQRYASREDAYRHILD